MFLPEELTGRYGLNEVYANIRWQAPPVTPEVIEFVCDQEELMPGLVYMAQECTAEEYFKNRSVKVNFGAIMLVSDAVGDGNNYREI